MLHKNGITIDPSLRTIAFAGKKIKFRNYHGRCIKFDLACRLIFGAPASNHELTDLIYNDITGGPDWAHVALRAHLTYLRDDLRRLGLKIYTEPGGERGGYFRKWIAA